MSDKPSAAAIETAKYIASLGRDPIAIARTLDAYAAERVREALAEASKHCLQFYPLVGEWRCDCGQKLVIRRKEVAQWREHIAQLEREQEKP